MSPVPSGNGTAAKMRSVHDGCVTVRDRDTMEQVRMPIADLKAYLEERLAF